MPSNLQFGLFEDHPKGPLWRASFADLDEATGHARGLVKEEGKEFFVYSYVSYREMARIRRRGLSDSPPNMRTKQGSGRKKLRGLGMEARRVETQPRRIFVDVGPILAPCQVKTLSTWNNRIAFNSDEALHEKVGIPLGDGKTLRSGVQERGVQGSNHLRPLYGESSDRYRFVPECGDKPRQAEMPPLWR